MPEAADLSWLSNRSGVTGRHDAFTACKPFGSRSVRDAFTISTCAVRHSRCPVTKTVFLRPESRPPRPVPYALRHIHAEFDVHVHVRLQHNRVFGFQADLERARHRIYLRLDVIHTRRKRLPGRVRERNPGGLPHPTMGASFSNTSAMIQTWFRSTTVYSSVSAMIFCFGNALRVSRNPNGRVHGHVRHWLSGARDFVDLCVAHSHSSSRLRAASRRVAVRDRPVQGLFFMTF